MPETTVTTQPVPPRLIVSQPPDDIANTSSHKKSDSIRRAAEANVSEEQHCRQTSAEWIDIEDSPPRRRRKRKSKRRQDESSLSFAIDKPDQKGNESELGRFFPRLSRILESSETTTGSRPCARGSDTRQYQEKGLSRGTRHRDESASIHRRPIKHRRGGISRRTESLLRVNPSMLSVLTSSTGTSDRSSGSNSTLTQYSYDRRINDTSRSRRLRLSRSELEADANNGTRSPPSVFDYMMSQSEDGQDSRSVASVSSSSSYEPSDAGSSEAPGTPSSRSTFPSPTTSGTRGQSVAELRRKYDPNYASPRTSVRSASHSPDSSLRSARKQPSVSDVDEDDAEEDEANHVKPVAPSEIGYSTRDRSSSRSSRLSRHSSNDRLRHQEESLRQHTSYATQPPQAHYINPVYGQHRSASASSAGSERAYAYNMMMQPYQWPAAPSAPVPPHLAHMNGHISPTHRPPAPDPPDLNQRTIAGYELLALELSSTTSAVKPIYRKFEYLNHRILLHLQDELSELEDQLRHLDEIIAQMDPAHAEGQRTPASRRGEAWSGTDIHHARTSLLGRVFIKTEQYNRAMSAYSTMARDAPQAGDDQVQTYRDWMAKHAPVHEVESTFLQRATDLIAPGGSHPNDKYSHAADSSTLTKNAALACLPFALMLPLLLFSIIPTLGGRLIVTALIAVAAVMVVAATTRIRRLMPAREWAVCAAAYVLLMAAIAGCVPQHHA